ncbi:D-tyrosyl-tRNA(Tyr) deacylase [Peptoniphilus sp. oral taxon 375 str. F0436]|uniref:D-aminoacyl-tRNA deacylase n=1 Tax=Urinicoccus timonensis TaxID=2024205 RepID=UPI00021A254C|nr:D-aminoacyl-tRNA deacylase [Urinicoccus timonensis]EGS31462.1 D-tyrosyl-tRNA(Tyr) deacylase [Peptoniphilus sp. oral taxon 375 str. F0436]
MRALIQRVQSAEVSVDGKKLSSIGNGLLIFLGIKMDDEEKDIDYLVRKIVNCRIFDDLDGVMNESLIDQKKDLLVVSQFTLYADTKKGNRPSYQLAAKGDVAEPLYQKFITKLKEMNIPVQTGEFGADMAVSLINDGPVTILIES